MDESSRRSSKTKPRTNSTGAREKERDDGREPGTSLLPIARVAKIIKADQDVQACSKEATFLIGIATEFFIKRFAEQAYLKARIDHRKLVKLDDLAGVVQTVPEFTFLEDMIPMPMPLSEALKLSETKKAETNIPTDEEIAAERLKEELPRFSRPGAEGMEGAKIAPPKNKARAKGKSMVEGGEGEDGEGSEEEEGAEKAKSSKRRPASSRPSRRSAASELAAADGGDSDLEDGANAMQVDA